MRRKLLLMEIISRKTAQLVGYVRYFTGVPCKYGHVDKRHVIGGGCMECSRISARRYRDDNLDECRRKNLEWAHKNKDKMRRSDWKRYGLPEPTRPEPAHCELCGQTQKGHLHLDHDHSTGHFRGWLCRRCNLGLGMLGDTLSALRFAVTYLERN